MTDRLCLGCHTPERRGTDPQGRPTVNLNPLTDLCLNCTITAATESRSFPKVKPRAFDARAAAANDRGDS